jgi:hypothetical protein
MSIPKKFDRTTFNRRAICKDGFSLSVQASKMSYCHPRVDHADRYMEVEIGFPSEHEPLLAPYQEGEGNMSKDVFGYVPVPVVSLILIKHGGMVEGELPAGIPPFTLPSQE